MPVPSLGWEDPLEDMATYSSTLAWRIPWTEELGGLQSRSDVACACVRTCTHTHTHTHTHVVTRFLYSVKVAMESGCQQ